MMKETDVSDTRILHKEDFFAWSREQAEALRSAARTGSDLELDWESLAEEIEDLGISQKSVLKSQIQRIARHLLKLEHSSMLEPRRNWRRSVADARDAIEALLEDSPSLAREVQAALGAELKRGSRKAVRDLEEYGEVDAPTLARIRAATYTAEQILGDWLPREPKA